MPKGYRPYLPEQDLLLPPSLRDWLPENHLAYFVSDVVDQLDLSAIHDVYERDLRGQPPYDPRMMTKLPSITYNHPRVQLGTILMEQALIQSRIAFDLVFDQHLKDLSKYRVLILPETECLSDEQLAIVRQFVENGGGLVATGQAGMYDEWRRVRVKPGLESLIEVRAEAVGYQENVEQTEISGAGVRKEVAGGRVVYFPAVQFDGPVPEHSDFFQIRNRFWKLPKNWLEITESVRWAARDEIPATITGPLYLVANVVDQPEKRRRLIHLVNYNRSNVPEIAGVRVTCRLPEGARPKEVRLYSPDLEAPRTLPAVATIAVPPVKVYSVVAITW